MRLAPWVVRTAIFGGLGLLLVIAIGGRFRADRALDRVDEVRTMGTPGEVAARAQQAVSVWAGEPAVVVKVEREQSHWRAVALTAQGCYEVAVDDRVSAHPGLVACPPVAAAGVDEGTLPGTDPRRGVVVGFLDAWLQGDSTAERFLADDQQTIPYPGVWADDVKVTAVFGPEVASEPGARSLVTGAAEVTFGDRVENLAWTLALAHGDARWSVAQVAGGEIPTGDSGTLTRGRTFEQQGAAP